MCVRVRGPHQLLLDVAFMYHLIIFCMYMCVLCGRMYTCSHVCVYVQICVCACRGQMLMIMGVFSSSPRYIWRQCFSFESIACLCRLP